MPRPDVRGPVELWSILCISMWFILMVWALCVTLAVYQHYTTKANSEFNLHYHMYEFVPRGPIGPVGPPGLCK